MDVRRGLILAAVLSTFLIVNVSCEDSDQVVDVEQPPVTQDETPVDVPEPKVREVKRTTNVPIEFFGKVVDEQGKGIELAEVTVDVRVLNETPPDYKELQQEKTWTDPGGYFSFQGLSGTQVIVRNIEKEGFEFITGGVNALTSYHYAGGGHRLHSPEEGSPVIYTLVEQIESTHLLQVDEDWEIKVERQSGTQGSATPGTGDEFAFRFKGRGTVRHDFARKQRQVVKTAGSSTGSDFVSDLDMTVSFDYGGKGCGLILRSPGQGSGVILKSVPLGRAPDTGYRERLDLRIASGRRKLNVYVKSRNPPIYSVVEIGIIARPESCQLNYEAYVNPYGGTSLEQAGGLSLEELERLDKEAVDALIKGKRAEEPSFF